MADNYGDGGGGGGPAAPLPDHDFKPLDVNVDSVGAFGEALVKEAENIGNAGSDIKEQLTNPGNSYESALPVGRDPLQPTLLELVSLHTERMDDMSSYISSVQAGLHTLGRITKDLVAEFGDQDGLNGADLDRVREIIGRGHGTGEN